jgi:hypothetical protein
MRQASLIDDAITHHVLDQLQATFSDEGWQKMTASINTEDDTDQRIRERELQDVEQKMQTLLNGQDYYDDPDWIQRSQVRYRELKAKRDQIVAAMEPKKARKMTFAVLTQLRGYFTEELLENGWKRAGRDGQHRILQMLIDRIVLLHFTARAEMLFVIHWRDETVPPRGVVILPTVNRGNPFTYAETETIRQMLVAGAAPIEVRKAFPDHPKSTVLAMCRRMKVQIASISEISPTRRCRLESAPDGHTAQYRFSALA